jgi:ABC-type enterochelin transport system substrate-binding protein
MPKTYKDYKRELRENRDEIELTGSNKAYWRNLAKLIGKEKAAQRRKKAIDQRGKIRCATNEGVAVEVDKKDLEKEQRM